MNSLSNKTVIIVTYFPRSIMLEGIRRIALNTYDYYKTGGASPILLVPAKGDVPHGYKHMYTITNPKKTGTVTILYNMLKIIYSLRNENVYFYILENSPATPILTIFTNIFIGGNRILKVRFITPIQEFSTFYTQFLSYPNLQLIIHFMFCNKFLFKVFELLLDKDTHYVVGSKFQRQQLINTKLKVKVENPYFSTLKAPSHPPKLQISKPIKLGYLGHFSSIKGTDLLIEAYKEISKTHNKYRLLIAWSGKGNDANSVLKLIKSLNNDKSIEMCGLVNPQKFLSSIALLVLPYRSNSVPIPPAVLYEAFCTSTPVLISDIDGLTGEYTNYCYYFRNNKVESLSKKIIELTDI